MEFAYFFNSFVQYFIYTWLVQREQNTKEL